MSTANPLAASPSAGSRRRAGLDLSPARALTRQALRDARVRAAAFTYVFAIYAYIQPAGFRSTYPTLADRVAFAHSFAGNAAIRLFYGYPFDVVSIGGYSAWRVGGTLALAAGVFGVLAAVRALRAEEDAGRMELVLAGALGRRSAYLSALLAMGAQVLLLGLAEWAGFIAGGLSAGSAAFLALATSSVAAVFVGVGALTSQLAPTRRLALELGAVVAGVAWLLRVVADTVSGAAWVRWTTPLGWAEQLRPFAGGRPAVLVLPAVVSASLLVGAWRIAARRDVGTGLLAERESASPRLALLGSPTAFALRAERTSLALWVTSVGAFAAIFGMVAASISSAGISKKINEQITKLGSGSILTPTGYIAFVFIIVIVALSLFACAQVGAAREEEGEQRLETLLALPVSRYRWLGARLLLAASAIVALSLTSGLFMWVGARSQGVGVSLADMLEAGANCIPVAVLFLGLAALAYATVPRASAAIAYGLVSVSFLWYLVAALLSAPKWLVELTPFARVGLVPVHAFRVGSAVTMVAVGAIAAAAALAAFRRRDLLGA